jgi:type III restriction enzyme
MNLKSYYPDFVALDEAGTRWLVETKGQETVDVARKDEAAAQWCENATRLTGSVWKYLKVPQKEFESLRPTRLSELPAIQPPSLL